MKHFSLLVKKSWNTFRILSKKAKDFSHFVEKSETFFAFAGKKRNTSRILLKKVKHFSHLVKKVETLVAFYQKKQNTFRILFKKMKHFLRLFKKHLKHFSPSVEKIDTLFAFSQKKIEYLLQLVKKIQIVFATSWKSKEIFHLSFIFFLFEFFGTFVNIWEKIDGLSKSFVQSMKKVNNLACEIKIKNFTKLE